MDPHHVDTRICEDCGSACCTYVAMEIDKPTCKRDYDYIRWYLLHEGVHVFVDHEDCWFVEFKTPCARLGVDGRCTDYEDRPKICREHGQDGQPCEYFESPHKIDFGSAREFEAFLNSRGVDWRWRRNG